MPTVAAWEVPMTIVLFWLAEAKFLRKERSWEKTEMMPDAVPLLGPVRDELHQASSGLIDSDVALIRPVPEDWSLISKSWPVMVQLLIFCVSLSEACRAKSRMTVFLQPSSRLTCG